MLILHVVATPRGQRSRTLPLARTFLDTIARSRDDVEIDELDLTTTDLPHVDDALAGSKYALMAGEAVDPAQVAAWPRVEELVGQFLAADVVVITSPMWNFGLPYHLKHWIDCIVQPGYTFAYVDGYPAPLVHGRRMVCITSRGADYSPSGPMGAYDYQEPYLRAIFGFIGITDIEFVHAQPMDHPLLREQTVATALAAVAELCEQPHWRDPRAVPSGASGVATA